MPTYVCVDGPLQGRLVRRRRAAPPDQPLTVAVVDVGNGVLEVDYCCQRAPRGTEPGRLRFVTARDARLRPGRWRAAVRTPA